MLRRRIPTVCFDIRRFTYLLAEDERLELSSEQAHTGIPNQALTIRGNPQYSPAGWSRTNTYHCIRVAD